MHRVSHKVGRGESFFEKEKTSVVVLSLELQLLDVILLLCKPCVNFFHEPPESRQSRRARDAGSTEEHDLPFFVKVE